MTRRRAAGAASGLVAAVALAVALVAGACSSEGTRSDGIGSGDAPTHEGASGHDGHGAVMGEPAGASGPTRHLGPQGDFGQFVVKCPHSHSAPDDPIVYPDQPGRSHQHDFFGNTATDAASTAASLVRTGTTCDDTRDTAAYWAPQLMVDGRPVTPTGSVAYYRVAPGVDPAEVVAFPAGLKIVAGDMTATAADPQSPDLAGWTCGVSTRNHTAPPACPASAPLRAVMTFPDCWDGEHVDHDDHRSHMANSADGECPASHPVHVPQLVFAVDYPVAGAGHELTLASGAVEGIHADFFNAWDQAALEGEVRTCLNRDAVCRLASNRREDPLFSG